MRDDQADDNIIQIRMNAESSANQDIAAQDYQHTVTANGAAALDQDTGELIREKLLRRAREKSEEHLGANELAYRASQLGANRYKVDSTQALRDAAKQETERRNQMFRRDSHKKKETRIERHQKMQAEETMTAAEVDTAALLKKLDAATKGEDKSRHTLYARDNNSSGSLAGSRNRSGVNSRVAGQDINSQSSRVHHFSEPTKRGYDPYA